MSKLFKKLNNSFINIIIGLSIFILFSSIWDLSVGDVNLTRILLLIVSGLIVFISLILRIINIEKVEKTMKRQLGG